MNGSIPIKTIESMHGIIGQTIRKFKDNKKVIEGIPDDYEVSGLFENDFKFTPMCNNNNNGTKMKKNKNDPFTERIMIKEKIANIY